MALTKNTLYEFMRQQGIGVLSTVSPKGAPEAALVNLAVTPELELIFHALDSTRKYANLRKNPRIAAVIGWAGKQTVQYEGVAEEVEENQLDEIVKCYFEACPDASGRGGWPGMTYFRIRPTWIRYSSYSAPWQMEEMTFPQQEKVHARSFWHR